MTVLCIDIPLCIVCVTTLIYQLEYSEGYTVHSLPIYITRTTVTSDTYVSSVYICEGPV
jgi:hypothetical protein